MNASWSVLLPALLLGGVFGVLTQQTRFCTMGAVADVVCMEDWTRLRQWLLAIGVAVLGSALLHGLGVIDLAQSLYRGHSLPWLSHLVGGLCFGVGMVLASGCGARSLTRLGAGNLKSLVVLLVMALTAMMTLRGVLAVLRVRWLDPVRLDFPAGADLPGLLVAGGVVPSLATGLAALVLGGGLLAVALRGRGFVTRDNLLAGCGVGALVVLGWLVTGWLGYVPEHPETLEPAFLATNSNRMESLSFVAPVAYGTELLTLWSDSSRHLTFAIALALGVVSGSTLWAVGTRSFRWEGFRQTADLGRHLLGGALMGFGGVTAMGCTIGQGISAISTLALGGLISLAAILAGAVAMLRYDLGRA